MASIDNSLMGTHYLNYMYSQIRNFTLIAFNIELCNSRFMKHTRYTYKK